MIMSVRKRLLVVWGNRLLFGAVVFLCCLTLYAVTAQRGVSWQDSGYFQYRILIADRVGHFGLALAHPLYIALARTFSELFPAHLRLFAITLFSGLGMAVALTVLSAIVMRLTGKRMSAAVAVVLLGLSHMSWWMATVTEVYTWSLAGLMCELYCLVRFCEQRKWAWLIALFGVNGAHAAIHNFAFLSLSAYLVLFLTETRRLIDEARISSFSTACGKIALVSGCVGVAWLTGAYLLVWQVVADWKTGGEFFATLQSLLFGQGYERAVLGLTRPGWRLAATNLALAGVSLLNPCWLFVTLGWSGAKRLGAVRAYLLALTFLHVLFWCRYFVPDQATFILPTLGLLAVWAGIGYEASRVAAKTGLAVLVAGALCALAAPLAVSEVVQRSGVRVPRSRTLPFRNEVRYWLVPWKQNETSANRFVSEVERQLQTGDVLVVDATAAGSLLAAREAGEAGRDWRLLTPWSGETEAVLRTLLQDRKGRVFVVSPVAGYAPQPVLESTNGMERVGVLYRLR